VDSPDPSGNFFAQQQGAEPAPMAGSTTIFRALPDICSPLANSARKTIELRAGYRI